MSHQYLTHISFLTNVSLSGRGRRTPARKASIERYRERDNRDNQTEMQRDENLTNVSLSGRVKAPTERYRERQSRQSDRNTERRESPKCLTQWPREVDANEESAGRERYKRDKQITMPPHNATHNAERRIKTARSKRRQKYRETDRDRPTRRLNNTALSGLCGWRDTEHPQGKMHMHSICRKRILIQHTLRPCLDLPRARPSPTNAAL